MVECKRCSNSEICGKSNIADCEHYDKSFTRSEVLEMLETADSKRKTDILKAIADKYRLKLAF